MQGFTDDGYSGLRRLTNYCSRRRRGDPKFREAIDTLEMAQCLDYGIMATVFLSLLNKEFESFVIDPNSGDLTDFVLMAEMGFFTLTGDRYQMTLPSSLDMDSVKKSHLKLAGTEDEDWIHPEQLVVDVSVSQATRYQYLLRNMSHGQRLADRQALLFLDR